MKHSRKQFPLVLFVAMVMILAGCNKKVAQAPPPPPPPPPPAPTAMLTANPAAVQKGESSQLTWRTENATDVTIEGIGKVDASGTQSVTPADSTTYRLIARGAGGQQEATARVTVSQPEAISNVPVAPTATEEQLFAQNVQDVYFDYDSYEVRADAQQQLASAAQFLAQHPNMRVTIEGHADERGSTEYNLTLGDNRAMAVKDALVKAGLPAARTKTISYGKEKPFCTESTEDCWQKNRRGHFLLMK